MRNQFARPFPHAVARMVPGATYRSHLDEDNLDWLKIDLVVTLAC